MIIQIYIYTVFFFIWYMSNFILATAIIKIQNPLNREKETV